MDTMQLYFNNSEDVKYAVKALLDWGYVIVYDGRNDNLVVITDMPYVVFNRLRDSKAQHYEFRFKYKGQMFNQLGVSI